MKVSIIIYIIFAALFFSSCGNSKRLSRKSTEIAQLSAKLGIKVTKKDDLRLYAEASQWLGTPYRFGGESRSGVDCSGLVGQIYENVYRIPLQRTVAGIADKDCRKVSKGSLQPGDLVFFNTSKKKKGINHVGLFLKDNRFIHASSSKGVIVSDLREPYYHQHWKKGGRVKK